MHLDGIYGHEHYSINTKRTFDVQADRTYSTKGSSLRPMTTLFAIGLLVNLRLNRLQPSRRAVVHESIILEDV